MIRILPLLFFIFAALTSLAQSVDGGLKTLTATVVTTNNYAVTESLPAAYDPKERFIVKFPAINTGAVTLDRNNLGAKSVKFEGGTVLSAGDIKAGGYKILSYNGTYYQIVGGSGSGGGGSFTLTNGNGTTANGTAVDLGGTMTGNVTLTGGVHSLNLDIQRINLLNAGSEISQPSFSAFTWLLDDTGSLQDWAVKGGTGGSGPNDVELNVQGNFGVGLVQMVAHSTNGYSTVYADGNGGLSGLRSFKSAENFKLEFDPEALTVIFTDSRTSKKGIQYAATGYETDDLTLISRGYAAGKLAGKNITAPAVGQNGQAIRWNNSTPAWEYYTPTSVTPAALTKSDDTNVTLTLGGTPATALLQAASITVGWSGTLAYSRFVSGTGLSVVGRSANTSGVQADIVGTANQVLRVSGTTLGFGAVDLAAMVGATVLPVANGGTNIASYAVGDLLYASGATTLSKLADVAAGSYLRSGGVTTAPVWSTTTLPNSATTGDIMYASGSNAYANLAAVATGSVVGSAGTGTAPAYLAVSNGLTATATTFKLGGSLTAATTFTGSSSNTLTFDYSGLTTGTTDVLFLDNSTAALVGTQTQNSGFIRQRGSAWKSNATAASQTMDFDFGVVATPGAAAITGTWKLRNNNNAAGYSDVFTVSNTGAGFFASKLSLTGSAALPSLNLGSTSGGNPTTLTDGDLWNYGSGSGLAARVGSNTYSVLIGSASSGGMIPFANGNGIMGTNGSFTFNSTSGLLSTFHIAAMQNAMTSAWAPALQVAPGAHTGITLSTPKPNVLISASTQQWATGALASQANFEIGAETLAFVGGSTATEPTGLLVHAPIAGANANTFVRPSALTLDGHLFFKTGGTVFGIIGSTTNDAAIAGNVGEEMNSNISTYTNFTTTATYQNVTSIALTAGDWDISAFYTYSSNSATITAASNAIFVISTTTASAAGATEGLNIAYVPQAALLGTSKFTDVIGPYRVSLSGSATYYLNAQATFTIGNPQYVGEIRARRIR